MNVEVRSFEAKANSCLKNCPHQHSHFCTSSSCPAGCRAKPQCHAPVSCLLTNCRKMNTLYAMHYSSPCVWPATTHFTNLAAARLLASLLMASAGLTSVCSTVWCNLLQICILARKLSYKTCSRAPSCQWLRTVLFRYDEDHTCLHVCKYTDLSSPSCTEGAKAPHCTGHSNPSWAALPTPKESLKDEGNWCAWESATEREKILPTTAA